MAGKILLSALQGKKAIRPPFWFMRQAGRYLPEYRALREKHRDFLEFCYNPEAAAEATLQPVRRFGMDGAIIFSDILVVPHALGADVRFEEGIGPVLAPIQANGRLKGLRQEKLGEKLQLVYEALSRTKAALPGETALIGFIGAPWTLACYMIQGRGGQGFPLAKELAKSNDEFLPALVSLLVDAVIEHAVGQIKAGAEIIQIFDSWAGLLEGKSYERWVIAPARDIVRAVKSEFPEVPVIGFPRQSGDRYLDYAKKTGVDAVSFDHSVSLDWVKSSLQPEVVVQGGLDPEMLARSKETALAETKKIVAALKDKPFVFNLGHGILPHTPVENAQAVCDYLKRLS